MSVFLPILKIIGTVLLIVVLLVLVLVLLILFVPIRYKVRGQINDGETHDEFPLEILWHQSEGDARISWFAGIFKVLVNYPEPKGIFVKIFGINFDFRKLLHRSGNGSEDDEEKKEESEEKGRPTLEEIAGRIEKILEKADRLVRILTGSCGRRAGRKLVSKLDVFIPKVMPRRGYMRGTVGMGDPYYGGKLEGVIAILSPFAEDHLAVETEMAGYRCDLKADFSGKIRIVTVLQLVIPLLLDKDCKKLVKKIRRLRAMD